MAAESPSPVPPAAELVEPVIPPERPRRRLVRRPLRRAGVVAAVVLGVLLLLAVAAGLALWIQLAASLPQLDGRASLPGLSAPVEVERDALGVPTLRASSRVDVARALGFVHAQDRFFQMDLLRRQGAGELAELFGPAAVPLDRSHRTHRFRAVARRVLARMGAEDRAVLAAYTVGVNAGLAALGARPFEYLALRQRPVRWRPEDSLLVIYAMFFELQDSEGHREASLGLMRDLLPPALFAFLAPPGTEWDAPLEGGPLPPPPIPGPEAFDLRREPRREAPLPKAAALLPPDGPEVEDGELAVAGSNNWAVAGARTADGRALLANDMHLGLAVPNTWYRASLVWTERDGAGNRVTGVTLPGLPAVVAGSNGHVAWGFTNSYGDWSDLVELEVDPKDRWVYRTPRGPRRFERVVEKIRVRGGAAVEHEIFETVWGPVVGEDHRGRPRVLAWTAHHPEAVDFGLRALERARTVEQALAAANASGMPAQNFVVADESGRVGWTIAGRVPRRAGFRGDVPTSWADGTRGWNGWRAPAEVPRVVDPPSGRVWTANARVAGGEALAILGDGGYDLGARARQIRDDLLRIEKATPRDLLAVQLDDRAVFLSRWRDLLLRTLGPEALRGHPRREELRRIVAAGWDGRASVGSAAYRAVRVFRELTAERTFDALTARCRAADPEFQLELHQWEGSLWQLVTKRPSNLLDPRFRTWDEQLLALADATTDFLAERGGPRLADRTWGERNTVRIRHPLSRAVPLLGRWLDVAPRPLPGDQNMPRVQGPAFGASERLVVSPGHEEAGFFHMPVGQSGNPLSPHYRDGQRAWEEGRPTPFLPGKAIHRLALVPAAEPEGRR